MLNIIYILQVVLGEDFLSFLYRYKREPGPVPRSQVFVLDILMTFRNLHKGHLKTIHVKHHSNLAIGFRVEDLKVLYIDI